MRLPIRLAAATWCLSSCVLVWAYYSVIISFVTSPYYEPLVTSFQDVVKKPGVFITIEAGFAAGENYMVNSLKKKR